MTSGRAIGYYVHHHGDGHRQRALAIAAHLGGRATLLGTGLAGRAGDIPVVELPDDRLPGGLFDGRDEGHRPRALHYAPIDHDGVRRRTATIAGWIAENRPALMIVDVSVEVAMLARLSSVPTLYVRLGGRRDDPAHLEAFRSAAAILAPFAAALDDPATPREVRDRTIYAAGLVNRSAIATGDDRRVLVVLGRGGSRIGGEAIAAAARATPRMRWRVIGPCVAPADRPDNLEFAGWVADAADEVAAAGIVIGGAGDGLVGSVIAARRPLICLPEARPYDEQRSKAERLDAIGAAIVRREWPDAGDWPALLDRAATLDPTALARLDDPDGARRTATTIADIADGRAPARRRA